MAIDHTPLTSPNAFYRRAVLQAHGAPQGGLLPLERTVYGARAWRSPYTFLTAPRLRSGSSGWREVLAAGFHPILRFELLPADGPVAALGAAAADLGRPLALIRRFERPMLDASRPAEETLDRLSRQRRRNLRRARATLDAHGVVSYDRATDRAGVDAGFADFLVLEAGGWKGRRGTAVAQCETDRIAFTAALGLLADQGGAEIHRLTLDGRPIAAGIVLRDGCHAYFAKIAYDEAWAKASPGALLSLDLTRAMAADPGITLVDSCASQGNDMIAWLWPDRRPIADVVVAGRSSVPAFAVEGTARALRLAHDGRRTAKRLVAASRSALARG